MYLFPSVKLQIVRPFHYIRINLNCILKMIDSNSCSFFPSSSCS
uniref:Uncharacterized protein n=1 Tax=Lotus japonicus TaxID=34305 RepID=I3SV12_LOTJA|nr:unknown [Lotus japonicus]